MGDPVLLDIRIVAYKSFVIAVNKLSYFQFGHKDTPVRSSGPTGQAEDTKNYNIILLMLFLINGTFFIGQDFQDY